MKIKSIRLRNIRSYVDQRVDFPKGSILLSGNIGSGKTSLLLAIDFALFGLRRGNLSGSGLLRKGAEEGSVELEFDISDKNILIKRNLKKTINGVSQSAGYYSEDGSSEDLTPVELKQKILTLFNYPKEFLTKSKSLIYNYTVYTPQEEMKAILLADSKERLNILRRVFGIDKYKLIVENSRILVSDLKGKKKEFEIRSSDLDSLVSEKKIKELEIKDFGSSLEKLKQSLNNVSVEIESKKRELEEFEEKSKRRDGVMKNLDILNNIIESLAENFSKNNSEIKKLNEDIDSLEESIDGKSVENSESLKNEVLEIENEIRVLESENKHIVRSIGEIEFGIKSSEKIKSEIEVIDVCPTCRQEVSEAHKCSIDEKEDVNLRDLKRNLEEHNKKEDENDKRMFELKEKLERFRIVQGDYSVLKIKHENLLEKRERVANLVDEKSLMKKEIGSFNSQKIDLNKVMDSFPDNFEIFNSLKSSVDELLKKKNELSSQYSSVETRFGMLSERIENLSSEISKKLVYRERVVKYSQLVDYIEKEFVQLIQTIERSMMKKVHSDFDALFKTWFGSLIESEDLELSLDYEFSPIISQNGHDIDYGHLSGGERTAAALAYRLALNQVINTIMSSINTKDILILDEPTDGFSSEQVDKLRLVLESLDVEQTIIVSHDPKIESFVDEVIRFEKKEGESFIC
ncbi:AAA family ATPase [archaeon]|nr:AAA family ATPase [archaeon]MBT7106788.1 AAA family ATPase [archaeon]MBT7297292.1 AAA family ATPase [archaeon]